METIYTFTCDPDRCDSLIEFTVVDGFRWRNDEVKMICPCGRRMNYISKETDTGYEDGPDTFWGIIGGG